MRLSIILSIAAGMLLAACTAARADMATTYAGTIGKIAIIVELQDAGAGGAFLGRYAYLSKGVDIPLHGTASDGRLTLEEEKPCTDKLCRTTDNEIVDKAPIGAEWSLQPDAGGATLTGTWTDKDSGKSLPVKLEKKASRALPPDTNSPDMLDPSYIDVMRDPLAVISEKELPYDFLKLQHPLKPGKVVAIGESAYRMDTDARIAFNYPTVTKLGKKNPAALNRWLTQQRLQWSFQGFACLSSAYLGFDWAGVGGQGTNGYDDEAPNVSVDYLTPRLISLTESGSQTCGGPHPNNFETHRMADAATGLPVDTKDLVRGWVMRNSDGEIVDPAQVEDKLGLTAGPDDKLLEFIESHREKDSGEMADDDCGLPDILKTNLGVYLKDNSLVFGLVDMPYVSFACTMDLVKVPLKDARPLLTEAGARYFPELDRK